PCTELFYDLGPEAGTGPQDYMGGEGDRYMEFWNNVFMESQRFDDGSIEPLAMQSVDTGMGMERITMILQGQVTAYGTDLFQPIIKRVMAEAGANWNDPKQRVDLQVIADHLRSLTFVLSEGGQFSNEGRGYVLRRILRRAVRHGRRLGFEGPFLWQLAPTVAELFRGVYELPPHIVSNTCETLREEEGRFFRTIDRGMARIHAIFSAKKDAERTITGQEAFELYDTYGFPVDLTAIEAEENGFSVDTAGFQTEMTAQRERSRLAAKFYEDDGGEWTVLTDGGGRGFAGYGLERLETWIMRWRQRDDRVELVLDRTPFYAESGGEIADHGRIEGPGFAIAIDDVQKINGIVHHLGRVISGEIAVDRDTPVTAVVDVVRRQQKTIHHTATHLLHAALKHLVGAHVEQKGSVVEPDRLRFDFSHHKALSGEEIEALEDWVNAHIRQNEQVQITEDVPIDEAKAQGVVALFGEKYGDFVRTVRAGSDSFELCGGNHVRRTGDIGHLTVTSESAVAAGVRRIEAVVGHAADALWRHQRGLLRETSGALKTDFERLPQRVDQLLDEVKSLKKALDKARRGGAGVDADALIAAAQTVGGVAVVSGVIDADARETLAALVDKVRDLRPDAVVVLAADLDGKAAVIAAIGPKLKGDKRLHAGRIVQAVTAKLGGKGGGRPDFAQGGGAPEGLGEAIGAVPAVVAELMG
ncbi:MAG: alanine--tRNA ligase, partial [Myxococcales bacterium]|nr:alanine--tRNA ligase [Myxococcales bacterium]